jgi:hypothetical protein
MEFRCSIVGVLLAVSVSAFAQSTPNPDLATRLQASRSLFPQWDHGADLRVQARANNKDISHSLVINETPILCNSCPKPDPSDHPGVRMAAVASDVVLIARDIQNVSELTTNNAFVLTNSQMTVEQVWKGEGSDTHKGQLLRGGVITVTSPGGMVHVDGHTISVSVSNQVPMQIDHSYLLFLRYLPESSTYMVSSLDGFDITGATVIPLRTTVKPPLEEYLATPTTFLNLIHQSTDRAVNADGGK